MAYRLFKILLAVIIGIGIIAFALATWLTSTTIGNRELAFLINLIEPRLEMDIRGGSLLRGIEAHKLSWTDDFVSISASNVKSEWKPSCFPKRTLCASKIQLDALSIRVRAKNSSPRTEDIKIPKLTIPVNLSINNLQVNKLSVDYSDNASPVEIDNIKLSANSRGKIVDVENLSARYKNIVANTHGDVDLNDNISVSLSINALVEDIYEEYDLIFDGAANGALDQLSVTGSSGGAVETSFIAHLNTLAPNVPSKARISWKKAGWPFSDHHIAEASNGTLLFDGDIKKYKFDGSTRVGGKDIPNSDVKLQGNLTPSGIVGEDLEVSTLDGRVFGFVSVDWSDWKNKVDWSSELSFSDLNPDQYHSDFTGSLAGSLFASGSIDRDKTWRLKLKPAVIQGTLNDQAIHAHAVLLRSSRKKWDIESLRLISKDNQFKISGYVDDQWFMKGDLQLTKLRQLLPESSGSILGTINVSGPVAHPIADFNIQSKQLLWHEHSAQDLALSGRVDDFFNNNSEVKLDAKGFIADGRKIGALDLAFKGKKQIHNIKLNAQSINKTKASLTVDGELLDNRDWTGKLFSSTLNLPGHDLELASATRLNYEKSSNSLIVSPHCWRNSETSICLKNTLYASKSGRAEIAISPYSMRQLNEFLPQDIKIFGAGKVDIALDWGDQIEAGFRAIVNAEVHNGSLNVKSEDGENDLQLEYDKIGIDTFFDRTDIRTNIVVDSENLGTADVSFSIQPDIKPLTFTRGTLKLSDLDIRFLQPLLPDLQSIEGTISADGKITGAVADPAFIGNITLSSPILKSDQLPIQITGGEITAAIAGRSAVISGAAKSGNGEIKLYGEADWEDLSAWSLIVNAQGSSLVIKQKPLLESVVAPNIVVSIRPNKINMGGNIKIVAAAINIKEIPEGATHLSPDIVLAEKITGKALTEPKWALESDLTVILGDAVRLSGYGMRAQLKGDFRVVQTDKKPTLVFGEIEIPEGIYKSYGQDLKVDDGQVIFVGPINQTTLNIDAYREVDEVTAGLHLSGTLETPVVTLYSDPALEQERILAYIVLGRDIAAGDNNDSNILATAALSMGISNGRGLATDIAEAFGIREFNIEASGRGEDTQVLLSGRISERLLVRYGVGVFTSINTIYLRYDLSKKLYLETAQGLESAADLIYSFEF